MKRRKPKQKKRAEPAAVPGKPTSRRAMLRALGGWAAIVGLVGAGGWYAVTEVRASINEQDLTRMGNGVPTVVQIHDPQCPRCRALQQEARAALELFDDGAVQYVVVNIRGPEGRAFADRHAVGHVTLLLFDGAGRRVQTLQGNLSRDALVEAFSTYLGIPQSG